MKRPGYDELVSMAEAFDFAVKERRLGEGCCGFYYDDLGLIVVDSGMPEFEKRCTLCHELVHAEHHDRGCNVLGRNVEHRTRRETALHLIDPVEYQGVETMYGPDSYRLAEELDVTVQVVEDYKEWLSERPVWRAIVD